MKRLISAFKLAALAAGLLASHAAAAQAISGYTTAPVRIIVPYAAGGSTDVYARAVARHLSEEFGNQFVVDNRPGVATIPGTQVAARSPKDGSVLFFTTGSTFSSNPHLYKSLPYKFSDFAPIGMVGVSSLTITISTKVPVTTVENFAQFVKSKPGELAMGTTGEGSLPYLAGKTFEQAYGLKMIEVPYKGSPPALMALMQGDLALYADGISGAMPLHKAGKVRIVATTSEKRLPGLPDVPTMVEKGFPDFVVTNWFGLFGIAGMPKDIVDKVNASLVRLVAKDEFRRLLSDGGTTPESSTPEGFEAYAKRHAELTRKLIAPLNITIQ